ncbi:hypothetical protein LCGC14_0355440 [marine sediment metagenome]|uniref:Uncharacterized protein n=1 Tax=marine sediment metagenome TaxID=412755 RepID=A0A0F9TFD1_9ZZZZ
MPEPTGGILFGLVILVFCVGGLAGEYLWQRSLKPRERGFICNVGPWIITTHHDPPGT